MSKINDIVFFYNTIEENTEQSFAPTEDVFWVSSLGVFVMHCNSVL